MHFKNCEYQLILMTYFLIDIIGRDALKNCEYQLILMTYFLIDIIGRDALKNCEYQLILMTYFQTLSKIYCNIFLELALAPCKICVC
jgi:hypothetical protein